MQAAPARPSCPGSLGGSASATLCLQGCSLNPMVLGFPSLRGDFSVSAFVDSFHIFDHFVYLCPLLEISP